MNENIVESFLSRRLTSQKLDNIESDVLLRINSLKAEKYNKSKQFSGIFELFAFGRGAVISMSLSLVVGLSLGFNNSSNEYKNTQVSNSLNLGIFGSDNPYLINNKIKMNYEQ